MGMYKTGHTQNGSLNTYTHLIDKHGCDSVEAEAYLQQFKDDISFIKQAEAVREGFISKNGNKTEQ